MRVKGPLDLADDEIYLSIDMTTFSQCCVASGFGSDQRQDEQSEQLHLILAVLSEWEMHSVFAYRTTDFKPHLKLLGNEVRGIPTARPAGNLFEFTNGIRR